MAKYKIIPSSRTIVQSPISIGHKAEKGVEAIEFDLTAWVETYGSGTLTVIMRRWGDAIPYPIALEIDENNKATWTLSDIDTAKAGMAYAQLSYIVGDEVVKKSDIYTFRVMDSLTGEGEPPEAYESWLEHLTHLAAEAMAEVLDIEGIVTDKTLTVDGGIADAKAAGDALALKADKATTYTKTEVDALIDEVEVETDTTLEIAGAPADAAETGRQIGLLKADLDDNVNDLKSALNAGSRLINVNITKTEGTYYNPDGNLKPYAYAASAKLAVKKNEKYYYSGFIREGYASVGFENSDGTFTLVNLEDGAINDYEINVPQNATYLCLSTWKEGSNPLTVKELTKVLIDGNYIYESIEHNDQVIQTMNTGNIYDRCFSIENRIGFSFKGMDKGKIIFMSDDAKAVVSDVYSHFHSHGMPFSEAVPLDMLYTIANNGEKTINTLRAIVQDGGEILSHGLAGNTCNIETCGSLENVERELRNSKRGLVDAGFDIHGWISPQGVYEPAAVTLYPKYYRYGYMASNKNGSQFNMERIYLTSLGLAGAKAKVDEVETNRSVVILFSHFSNTELNDFSFEDLEELLTYIATKNVDVTTYRDCFYQYGSIT